MYEFTVTPETRVIHIVDDVVDVARLIAFAQGLGPEFHGSYGDDNLYGEPGNFAEWTFELCVRGERYNVEIVKLRRDGFAVILELPRTRLSDLPAGCAWEDGPVLIKHQMSQLPDAYFLIGTRPGEIWISPQRAVRLDTSLLDVLLQRRELEQPDARAFFALFGIDHAFEVQRRGQGLVFVPYERGRGSA